MTLGAIEAANGIYVRQKLVSVAYDLARSAANRGDQSAAISLKASALFKTYGIKGAKYSFSPSDLATVTPGHADHRNSHRADEPELNWLDSAIRQDQVYGFAHDDQRLVESI